MHGEGESRHKFGRGERLRERAGARILQGFAGSLTLNESRTILYWCWALVRNRKLQET
jgi:hypothetical protein